MSNSDENKCADVKVSGKTKTSNNKRIGCDSCDKWYHFRCAGYRRMPSKRARFICKYCK